MPGSEKYLYHYGIERKSGRYPWGSGEDPYQRSGMFQAYIKDLQNQQLTDSEIAKIIDAYAKERGAKSRYSTTHLRATKTLSKNAIRAENQRTAMKLKDKKMSVNAIAHQMGMPESTVRALLEPSRIAREDVIINTSKMLRDQVDKHKYIDVGLGTELHLDMSKEKLATAVAVLLDDGYRLHFPKIEQPTSPGKYTEFKVLTKEDTEFKEIMENLEKIRPVTAFSDDHGNTITPVVKPVPLDLNRVAIKYNTSGDGEIHIRPGVPDLTLGEGNYAQVRISVDDTHYMKGMGLYDTNIPKGVDVEFHTGKSDTGDKLDALKPHKEDEYHPENIFGAITRQNYYTDHETGEQKLSPINIVGSKSGAGEEGSWEDWSKSLSSQMLSKQPEALAKSQLAIAYDLRKNEFDENNALTNSAVKKRLLESFAEDCDSAAGYLKAAAIPRQSTKVLINIESLKDNEVYAPTYRPGEKLVLIRHPHGGRFEIPELKVNNNNLEAKRILGNAQDAIGINSTVAKQLSGADFDGDAVVVIPNKGGVIKHQSPLKELADFDPKHNYPPYDGMTTIDGGTYNAKTGKVDYGDKKPNTANKQREMGRISNLITDMTIKGAPDSEIARAVKHSMVVIDSEKHMLNHVLSKQENGINQLTRTYQEKESGKAGGASTIISRAKGDMRVPRRRLARQNEGGPVNPETGELNYVPTGDSYVDKNGKLIVKTQNSTKMAETKDARTLVSSPTGQPIEFIYADHANKLKALANQARLEALNTKNLVYNSTAKITYAKEVESLDRKLTVAKMNKPMERQAQAIATAELNAKKRENKMSAAEYKKAAGRAIETARNIVKAQKQPVQITPREWEAIQAGAITHNKLTEILKNTDTKVVKEYATPRTKIGISPTQEAKIKLMLARGYTQQEIADQMNISTSTVSKVGRK